MTQKRTACSSFFNSRQGRLGSVGKGSGVWVAHVDKLKKRPHCGLFFNGRSEATRTPGLLVPTQARYQLRYTPKFYIEAKTVCTHASLTNICMIESLYQAPLQHQKILRVMTLDIFCVAAAANRLAASAPGGASASRPTALHPESDRYFSIISIFSILASVF